MALHEKHQSKIKLKQTVWDSKIKKTKKLKYLPTTQKQMERLNKTINGVA